MLTWAIVGWFHGANAQTVALQCQLDGGAWQTCRMQVQDIGRTWRIEMGKDTVLFRHDGGGTIAMKQGGRPWRLVQTRWMGCQPRPNPPSAGTASVPLGRFPWIRPLD
jgi:hypothetical protein